VFSADAEGMRNSLVLDIGDCSGPGAQGWSEVVLESSSMVSFTTTCSRENRPLEITYQTELLDPVTVESGIVKNTINLGSLQSMISQIAASSSDVKPYVVIFDQRSGEIIVTNHPEEPRGHSITTIFSESKNAVIQQTGDILEKKGFFGDEETTSNMELLPGGGPYRTPWIIVDKEMFDRILPFGIWSGHRV